MMLHPRGVGVRDHPPGSRYALPDHQSTARTFEPYIVLLLPDEEAWEALFDEQHRLDTFRTVYGNRKGRRPKPRLPTLFDA